MKLLLIYISLFLPGFLWSTPAIGCEQPSWYRSGVMEDDLRVVSYQKDPLLSNAIAKAQKALWIQLYSSDQKEGGFRPGDFLNSQHRTPSQSGIDNATHMIYRAALSGIQRKRSYKLTCNTYFLKLVVKKSSIGEALRNRDLIKEFVYFVLEGKHNFVREELNWQKFWSRHGLTLPDYSDQIEDALKIATALAAKKSLFMQRISELTRATAKKSESMFLQLYATRIQARFLNLRRKLMVYIPRFKDSYAAAKAASLNDMGATFRHIKSLAESGESEAYPLLSHMFEKGIGGDPNPIQAYKWLAVASRTGDLAAKAKLVDFHIKGIGTEKNYQEAIEILDSLGDSPDGQVKKAKLFMVGGHGLAKNVAKGIKSLETAAFAKNKDAAYQLGKIYLTGKHVDKDLDAAISWLSRAQENGSVEAKKLLNSIAKPGSGKKLSKNKSKTSKAKKKKKKKAPAGSKPNPGKT